jgi:hypothetical protein
MDVPGLDGAGPRAGEIDLAELDKVRVRGFEHVHDFAALIDDLPQRDDFNAVDHEKGSRVEGRGSNNEAASD